MSDFAETHARTNDPETSKAAAADAKNFYKSHCGIIYAALVLHGPQTVDELALNTDLRSHQVNKRLPDLQRMGLASPSGDEGQSDSGKRCRYWTAHVVDK